MPTRERYKNQKLRHAAVIAGPDPGNTVAVGGKTFTIIDNISKKVETARLEKETKQTRARHSRHNKTEARKASKAAYKAAYEKTPAGKAKRQKKDAVRYERERERKIAAPFWGIDTEGVSMHGKAWIENEGEPEEAKFVPQKIVVLAAGREDDIKRTVPRGNGIG